jgi:hypothetical protein
LGIRPEDIDALICVALSCTTWNVFNCAAFGPSWHPLKLQLVLNKGSMVALKLVFALQVVLAVFVVLESDFEQEITEKQIHAEIKIKKYVDFFILFFIKLF